MSLTREECEKALEEFVIMLDSGDRIPKSFCELSKEFKIINKLINEHFELLEKYEQLNKSFYLFIEWADECDFGYDNIPDLYEKYEEEIKDMRYYDGFKYIAMKEAEREAKDRVY